MLCFRDVRQKWLLGVGVKNRCTALIEPVNLLMAQQANAAKNQLGDTLRIRLRVGERQRGAPRAAEDLPALNAQVARSFSISSTSAHVVLSSSDA